jgi:pimeloyl-ACP methyl ester carboxylesterase
MAVLVIALQCLVSFQVTRSAECGGRCAISLTAILAAGSIGATSTPPPRPSDQVTMGAAMPEPTPELASAFKSAEGEARYLAVYDALMARWPVPYDTLDVTSRFGRTHLVASGPPDAPPLVLLHAYSFTLAMWAANAAELRTHYRIYALDVMGQPGRSVPNQPIASRADYAEWLTSVLNALRLDRVHLVGMSYGGWLTLNYAMAAPDRLEKIALLSPAGGFLRIVRQFTLRGMPIMLLAGILPTRFFAASFCHWLTYKEHLRDPEMRRFIDLEIEQLYLGARYFRMRPDTLKIRPVPFTDAELQTVSVPTLLLIGENEVLYNPHAALARARRLIPELDSALVPRASHDMSFTRHDVVDAHIIDFFGSDDPARAADADT